MSRLRYFNKLSPHRRPRPLTRPMLLQLALLNQLARMQQGGIELGGHSAITGADFTTCSAISPSNFLRGK